MNKEYSCKNCKYFRRHYYWADGKLLNAHSGHCFKYSRVRLVRINDCCDKWEQGGNPQKRLSNNIKALLLKTARQIEDIAAILKCEN